jgi:hypothetical protein
MELAIDQCGERVITISVVPELKGDGERGECKHGDVCYVQKNK